MQKYLSKYYYKLRIIFTVAIISVVLVITMSRVSYYFVKDLYLEQLKEQLAIMSGIIAEDIDADVITLLELGKTTKTLDNYLDERLSKESLREIYSDIFICNSDLEIFYSHSKSADFPEINFYSNDIALLPVAEKLTTIPFEGIDGNWYLYNFDKIGNNTIIGIKANATQFARIEEFDSLFWLLGLIGTLIFMFISWILANSITKPVNKLVKFSQLIGDSSKEIAAPSSMKGELGILNSSMIKMQRKILKNQKDRENMLAQIAHEIRNPLGGIELLAGLTKEDLQKADMDFDYQQRILNEVRGLKELITSFLNFSKPSPAHQENINLSTLLNEIEDSLKLKVKKKSITVEKNIAIENILFDKDQLKHIVINLFLNAIEAVDDNGKISLSCYSENGNKIISIKDNGTGIDKEALDKIFEPFFTTKKDGSGLGLAISKKLCHENNADLKIFTNGSKGVTFKIIKET